MDSGSNGPEVRNPYTITHVHTPMMVCMCKMTSPCGLILYTFTEVILNLIRQSYCARCNNASKCPLLRLTTSDYMPLHPLSMGTNSFYL